MGLVEPFLLELSLAVDDLLKLDLLLTADLLLIMLVEVSTKLLLLEVALLFDTDLLLSDGVLLGIMDRPGEDVFRATGGGVFRLLGTGDFSLTMDLSGVLLRSLRIGKFRSIGIGDLLRSLLNKDEESSLSEDAGDLDL